MNDTPPPSSRELDPPVADRDAAVREPHQVEAAHAIPDWQRAGMRHVWMPYTQMKSAPVPLPVVRTEDVYLVLEDGRRLIDGLASWWTACHGYNQPHLVRAVHDQLQQMPHVMFGGIHHPQAVRLAQRLARLLPGDLDHVFFCDSGSVAVEVAMKMAVQYWRNQGERERHKFVSFRNAYHGDTLATMSVCDPVNSMHAHFAGWLPSHHSREIPATRDQQADWDRFLAAHRGEVAGVLIEPLVQGAGGMKFHDASVLAFLRASCDRHGVLLLADEIATGFGRTGTMFACEQAEIVPDIICLGKALTGGMLSMAATVATSRIFAGFLSDEPLTALMHGPTYMANPTACAAANASLDLFESEPRLEQARAMEAMMGELLVPCRRHPEVIDVRCRGGVGVVQVASLRDLDWLRAELVRAGVWLRPFGDMVYMTPPLTIQPGQLQQLCEATVDVLRRW